jgi:hypothetical protein
MATPYTDGEPAQWQDPSTEDTTNFRSVTPAMNNIRRNPSPAPSRGGEAASSTVESHYHKTPNDDHFAEEKKEGPSSTGLIRLTLRKPMGIVFEPMYDPSAPSVQRGVRVCDLPRTGAAALSHKLEVGDELLSINDKTMSRLTFDEIMDFIIEADPETVNLLFRRPRKEVLTARLGNKPPSGGPGVKWVDDGDRKVEKEKKPSKKEKKSSRRSRNKDDDETLQTEDDVSYGRSRRGRRRQNPYESESFLDILIDTICANPDSVCRDRRRMGDDDTYYSEDDETFASRDDSTYVTYESEPSRKKRSSRKSKSKKDRNEDYSNGDDAREDKRSKSNRGDMPARRAPPKEELDPSPTKEKKYEDDGTLETVDSQERAKALQMDPRPETVNPLGLVPNPEPTRGNLPPVVIDEDELTNPAAPINALEFDEDADIGADVSVMDSLGGPSLLIEKQRQAQIMASTKQDATPAVSREIADNFAMDYPLNFGFTREQTIQNDPLRFYSFVVRGLLQEHEPEKVRLLDKLLAKYKGREDHLVQKLSVRYISEEPGEEEVLNTENFGFDETDKFEDAVVRAKESSHSREIIETARERMHSFSPTTEWPEKETKEPELFDEQDAPMDEKDVENTSQSQYSDDEVDGTSPAVIAQVSELLNYVYGKTSVPGQIDRVSTIMRAYEGREAVLLELLETKALIKANREKENAGNLPSFLRNSANAQKNLEQEIMAGGDMPAVTPMAMQNQPAINDDISSMSGVSTPAPPGQQAVLKPIAVSETKIHTFFQLYPCSQLVFLCCSLHRKPPSQFDQPSMSTQVWIRTRIEP